MLLDYQLTTFVRNKLKNLLLIIENRFVYVAMHDELNKFLSIFLIKTKNFKIICDFKVRQH